MSRWPEFHLGVRCAAGGLLLVLAAQASGADRFPGIGRAATTAEVAAWDIDVRPDFKGLPPGKGSVAEGQIVWEARCESCHGVFGESNQVFSPLVGGTTAQDVKTGRVARLTDPAYPGRTTLMKVPTLSTLWDYIHRAMPWNQPKSLKPDEVYAVTAYLLNLGGILPESFTLSNQNIAEVQQRMPNRNGMTTGHAMWPGRGMGGTARADVQARACMRDCPVEDRITSSLPDFARNQHGNLAEQNRWVGAQHGADTTQPERKGAGAAAATVAQAASTAKAMPAAPTGRPEAGGVDGKAAIALAAKHACTACHGMAQKIVGPGFVEIGKRHSGKQDYLAGKIRSGGSGVWGAIPMPPQTLSDNEARLLAAWIAAGAPK